MPRAEIQTLRPAKTLAVILVVMTPVFFGAAAWMINRSGFNWVAGFFLAFGGLNNVGALQQMTSRVRLLPDRIEFGDLFRTTRLQKSDIESVTWEKGSGVSLRMKNQKWVRVPDVGAAQSVCNSIRAWLKR